MEQSSEKNLTSVNSIPSFKMLLGPVLWSNFLSFRFVTFKDLVWLYIVFYYLNRNMMTFRGILPTHVTRLQWKSTRRIRLQNARKTKKQRKSRKTTERVLKRDAIFTALVRLAKNDSRIPVHFPLTSSCGVLFAAFKAKVLEACGLSCCENVQFFYLHNNLKVQLCETTWATLFTLRYAQIIRFH